MAKLNVILFLMYYLFTFSAFSAVEIPLVQVLNLEDLNSSYTPGIDVNDKILINNFCIASLTNSRYKVKFTSLNGIGRNFRVKNSSNRYIRYYLNFFPNNSPVGVSYSATSDTQISRLMNNGKLFVSNCSIDNDTITITFLQNDLYTAIAGVYTDVLTIYVVPN